MTKKFDQGMYAKMRAKKNEPFSSLEKRTVCVMKKRDSVTSPAFITEPSRIASPTTSVEELHPSGRSDVWTTRGKIRLIPIHLVFLMMPALRWRGYKRLSLLRS